MKKVLRIGDEIMLSNEDLEALQNAQDDITKTAQENLVDISAVLKKNEHSLVIKRKFISGKETKEEILAKDIDDVIHLVSSISRDNEVNKENIVEIIKQVIKKEGDKE